MRNNCTPWYAYHAYEVGLFSRHRHRYLIYIMQTVFKHACVNCWFAWWLEQYRQHVKDAYSVQVTYAPKGSCQAQGRTWATA